MMHIEQQQQPYPSQAPYQPKQQHQQPYAEQQQQIGAIQNTPYSTLYSAAGTPVQIVNVAPNDGTYQGYNTNAARILGWIQIVCGVLVLIAQIVITALRSISFEAFSGFWAFPIFILAGTFGVQSSKTKSQCAVITTMVFSIIAVVLSIGPIIQGSMGATLERECYYSFSGRSHAYRCHPTRFGVAVAFHAILIIFGLLEGIVAIIAAAYCCHGCCCYNRPVAVLNQNAAVGSLPLNFSTASGGMQVTAWDYNNPAVHYQHNPAQYYPAPLTFDTNATSAYPTQEGAPDPLPSYSAATPPPEYREKV